ncbi:MAG: response regulator transcription factor [Bacteroidota bacterium]
MKNVLFFSSNAALIENLLTEFINNQFRFTICNTVKDSVHTVCNQRIDACIIDHSNADGASFLSALKLIDETIPTILLVDGNQIEDKLKAFELGCTEYIFKPILTRELKIRLESLLKSVYKNTTDIQRNDFCNVGDSTIDFSRRLFNINKLSLPLSRKEAELLKLLCFNKNKLVTREFILNEVWKSSDYYASKSMDVYLTKVRKIIREDQSISLENIHGSGYMLKENQLMN